MLILSQSVGKSVECILQIVLLKTRVIHFMYAYYTPAWRIGGMPVDSPSRQIACTKIAGTKKVHIENSLQKYLILKYLFWTLQHKAILYPDGHPYPAITPSDQA